jgi:hypothetical protein
MIRHLKASVAKKGDYFYGRVITDSGNAGVDGIEHEEEFGVIVNIVNGGSPDSITFICEEGEIEISKDQIVAVFLKVTIDKKGLKKMDKILEHKFREIIIEKLLDSLRDTPFLNELDLNDQEKQAFMTEKRKLRKELENLINSKPL